MKHRKIYTMFVAATATFAIFTGCKTTEANYRTAYERTLAKQNEGYSDEILDDMRREEAIPRTLYKGDSIPLRAMYFNTVKEDSATRAALKYNVVTGIFAQRFNANSAVARLRENGWPDALMLVNGDRKYIISAYTTQNLDSAVTVWRRMVSEPPYRLPSPFPYILQRP